MKTKILNSGEFIDLIVSDEFGNQQAFVVDVPLGYTNEETFEREVRSGKYMMRSLIKKPDIAIAHHPESNRVVAIDFANQIYYRYRLHIANPQ